MKHAYLDMGAHSADGSQVFPLPKVAVHLDILFALLLGKVDVHSQVLQIARECACSVELKISLELYVVRAKLIR